MKTNVWIRSDFNINEVAFDINDFIDNSYEIAEQLFAEDWIL